MRKRGEAYGVELLAFKIFMVVAAVGLGLMAWAYVASNVDNTYFWKNFYAKDISLTMDALTGVPGDTEITYKQRSKDHEFEMQINTGNVQIFQIPRDKSTRWYYPHHPSLSFNQQSFFTTFPLKTTQGQVILDNQNQTVVTCGGPDTTDSAYTQKEHFFDSLVSSQSSLAYAVSQSTMQRAELVKRMRIAATEITADMFVYFDQADGNETVIFYAYDKAKSKKLACFVQRGLADAGYEVTSKQITSVQNVGWTQVLVKEPSIIIQVGKDQDIQKYPEIVVEGIHTYYQP